MYSHTHTHTCVHTRTCAHRLKLATLYVQLGQPDDALALLEAEPGGGEGAGYHSDSAVSDFDPRSDIETRDKSVQVRCMHVLSDPTVVHSQHSNE